MLVAESEEDTMALADVVAWQPGGKLLHKFVDEHGLSATYDETPRTDMSDPTLSLYG